MPKNNSEKLEKIKEALRFKILNDAKDIYTAKELIMLDNADMNGQEVASTLRKFIPSVPDLVFFHDEIKQYNKSCVFILSSDLNTALRIANRATLKMVGVNQYDNHILMVFLREDDISDMKISLSKKETVQEKAV